MKLTHRLLRGIAQISQLFPNRCPRIGICTTFQQQPGLRIVGCGERDNCVVKRRMSAEPVAVYCRHRIYVGASFDKPPRHVDVIIFDSQVEQRAAKNRCCVHAVTRFDPKLGGEDLSLLESVFQKRRVAVQVGVKQVNAAAMNAMAGASGTSKR